MQPITISPNGLCRACTPSMRKAKVRKIRRLPTLGLCVTVKNGAATLQACLESVRGLVDSVVVVNTGSTDATAEIARQAGAVVVSFPWNGSFADARNAALKHIDTDWVLVLDADEELDGEAHAWIRGELRRPQAQGYVVPVRNYLRPAGKPFNNAAVELCTIRHPRAPDAANYFHSEVCRLFRHSSDVYYVGQVHEQVEYRMLQLGRPLARADFFIHHFGWYLIEEEAWRRKQDFYSDLLAEKLRERPDDAQVLVQYGDALGSWQGKHREALDCFMQAAALAPEKHDVWLHIAVTLLKLGQAEAALVAIERVADGKGRAALRAQLRGDCLRCLDRHEEARAAFLEALAADPHDLVLRVQIGVLEQQTGRAAEGNARLRDAVVEIEQEAEANPHSPANLRAAELHARLEQWEDALRHLRIGLTHDSKSLPLQQLRLKAGVATGRLEEAADAAACIVELEPTPRAVLRHAAILSQFGNHEAAAHTISRGLERFPLSDELQQAGCELGVLSAVAV